jgi:hypothetical protein
MGFWGSPFSTSSSREPSGEFSGGRKVILRYVCDPLPSRSSTLCCYPANDHLRNDPTPDPDTYNIRNTGIAIWMAQKMFHYVVVTVFGGTH